MTSPTDALKRRLKKKAQITDDETTESTPDSESTEGESPTNSVDSKKPVTPSSFSADALKRRVMNKDKYGVN